MCASQVACELGVIKRCLRAKSSVSSLHLRSRTGSSQAHRRGRPYQVRGFATRPREKLSVRGQISDSRGVRDHMRPK